MGPLFIGDKNQKSVIPGFGDTVPQTLPLSYGNLRPQQPPGRMAFSDLKQERGRSALPSPASSRALVAYEDTTFLFPAPLLTA